MNNASTHDRHSIRMHVSWFVVLPAVLTLIACGAAGSAQLQRPAGSTVTLTMLEQLAKTSAAFDGDPNVSSAEVVLTTEHGAGAVTDELPDPSKPVYLVQTQGHFTANGASIPPPATKLPTGSYNILEIDASNGELLGAGVSTAEADLASLGPVITLPL